MPEMTSKPSVHRTIGRSPHLSAFLVAAVYPLIALFADHAWADRVNFAKYQETTSTPLTGAYGPEFAVDGIVSNFHSFRTANTTDPQWIELKFPRSVTIASAHLYLGLDNDPAEGMGSFKFQYFDGSVWVDVPGSAVTGNTATERSVIFSSAPTSDRFRFYTDEDGSHVVRELALFPPNLVSSVEQGYPIGTDVRLSLAHQRPTLASNIASSGYAKLAVDGYVDDTSRWTCAATTGQTLEVDLLDTNVIGSAHVYTGLGSTNVLAAFTLEYWTGTAWAAIPGATITGNTSTARVVAFSANVSTSKIRLRTTSASAGRVKELLVFPPRAGGYPLGQDIETSPPPTAKWDDYSDSTYRPKNGGPDNRLSLVNGTVTYSIPSTTATAIEWQLLLNHRDGSYRVRHIATGGCLALGSISRATNTPVVVETYSGMPHQDWYLDFTNATQFRLINVYSGLAINPAGSSTAAGTPMVVATPGAGTVQLWTAIFRDYYPKKGLGGYNASSSQLNGSWSYNWGRSSSNSFSLNHTFNPMQWGDYWWSHGTKAAIDTIRNDLQSNPKPAHLMGFNEPDHTDQANMTSAEAIDRWPRLEALNAPLVGPCPASTFGGWQDDFSTQADALGYRRDYTPYHAYGPPNVDSVISDLQNAYNTFGRPIWLTEFSVVDWSGTGSWTLADNYNFLAEFMWRAESLTWLKRYALFQFTEGGTSNDLPTSPRSNTWKTDGSLTAFGALYASWDGVTSVVPAKAYHVHNRGEYDRIRNPGTVSTPTLVDPINSGAGTQWFLTAGTTANTYRLISTRDGRPLRYSGTAVDLGTIGQTITSVEWSLTADQDGWYFLDHPATGKRLKDNGNGTYSMFATTITTDAVKWRFVVPLSPESIGGAPSAIPQQVTTIEDTGAKTFKLEGGDADGNPITFAIVTLPTNGTLAGTAPNMTYTPFANFSGADSFTFRVNDGTVNSADATVSITVTEVNDAPVANPQSVTMSEDGLNKAITLSGSDVDGDSLTYSIVAGPSNGALGGTGRNRTYTPVANFNGAESLTFKVNDGTVDSPAATVSITINAVNDAPVLAAIPAQAVNESALLTFAASATDVDLPANTLTYSLVGAPTGAAISPSSGVFTWTPTDAQGPASYNFTARVSDGTLTSSQPVAVTVYGILGNPGDDTDGDGVSNLLEWALHLDPVKSDTFTPILDTTAPGFFYTYTRRKNTNAVFQVEWADTLGGTWSTAGVGSATVMSQTTTSETLTVPMPVNTTGRFYRLKVTRQ